jgi:SAM-dependent methyltransferase
VPPFYADDRVTVHHGDCLDVLRTLPDCSVDSVVTDPPAGVAFMGKDWDTDKGGRDAWVAWLASVLAECRRVLKPGGHALVWALPRTSGWTHRAIEDAGLDVRDCITHLFGSGFPKSLDVGRAIDRTRHLRGDVLRATAWIAERATAQALDAAAGTNGMGGHWTSQGAQAAIPTAEAWERIAPLLGEAPAWLLSLIRPARQPGEAWQNAEVIAVDERWNEPSGVVNVGQGERQRVARQIKAPATEDAARWDGFGTALKPSSEMWYLARKPFTGTIAQTVTTWGTGALNIAATRVEMSQADRDFIEKTCRPNSRGAAHVGDVMNRPDSPTLTIHAAGRWPSNVVLTHSPTCTEDVCAADCCPVAELDAQSGVSRSSRITKPAEATPKERPWGGGAFNAPRPARGHDDEGGASRFFPVFRYQAKAPTRERPKVDGVAHPTCKPLALMRWLIRLVTPPGGVVLDPFAGSGTTAEAAILEGFRCVTIEREADYLPLILARIQRQNPVEAPRPVAQQMSLLDDGSAA